MASVWSNTSGSTVNTSTGAASAPIFGSGPEWNGGIQLGYDYMMPSRVVLGVEADVSSGGKKITTITDASGTSANQTTVFDSETVRGRLGYAFNNILLYGTAGWAWSNNQFIRTQLTGTLNLATAGTDEAVNAYLGGWTCGRRHRSCLRAELERVRRVSLLRILARPLSRCRSRNSPRLRRPK